jgi:hypothetical protein
MVCVLPFTFNVTGIVPGTAGAIGVACSCASALAAGAAIGTIVPAAVATLDAPMYDRNDLLLSLPNEEAGSFWAFSSVVKTFLLITTCPCGSLSHMKKRPKKQRNQHNCAWTQVVIQMIEIKSLLGDVGNRP